MAATVRIVPVVRAGADYCRINRCSEKGPRVTRSHTSRFAEAKAELLTKAAATAVATAPDLGPDTTIDFFTFLEQYYHHVSYEDLAGRDPHDIAGPVLHQLFQARERVPGSSAVSVFSPEVEHVGWSSHHSVVQVCTDDMSFLVDSMTADLVRSGHAIHLVVHPVVYVLRDAVGVLRKILSDEEAQEATGAEGALRAGVIAEAWIHVEIDRESDEDDLKTLDAGLRSVLSDVRESVEDWQRMQHVALAIADDLEQVAPPVQPAEIEQTAALLRWLASDNFTFLGYREYRLHAKDGDILLRGVPGTGLGVLRADTSESTAFSSLPPEVRRMALDHTLLILTKANTRSTVHRPAYLDYIGIKTFGSDGQVSGERRFVGLFTAGAYTQSVRAIPFLSRKLDAVLEAGGFSPNSHNGRDLLQFVETYPRDELFSISPEELLDVALQVGSMQERRQVRLFLRPDDYLRFTSCLVYLPRDRYSTDVRTAIEGVLLQAFGGESIDFTARVSESVLARLHFVVRLPRGALLPDIDVEDLEKRVAEATRSWEDELVDALLDAYGEEKAAHRLKAYDDGFPESYKEDFDARVAVTDIAHMDELAAAGDMTMSLYESFGARGGRRRFKVFSAGGPVSLSTALPMLQRMGADVVEERPYTVQRRDGMMIWLHDFGFTYPDAPGEPKAELEERFQQAFRAIWGGEAESDGFNSLVLLAGLQWREAAVLRAYAKYLRQTGSTFSQEYIEQAVVCNLPIASSLVKLFRTRFDPTFDGDRDAAQQAILADSQTELDAVASLDQDRILRSLLAMVMATMRTNWFQRDEHGRPHEQLSLKLDPEKVLDLPLPLPQHEIWVYSPRVEGVHLRFGAVARGGLRWSDRREDFRTEILGLVKAQAVKNAVIVPTGAKGGFVVKNPPANSADRTAVRAEGVACYSLFIQGLLDITDNRVGPDQVIPPQDVVRYDGDDPYLVVAADKGTASFSDTANAIALGYGFWLGDAFASGGSEGYDHKEMGITARGAWESVKRHFRELGVNVQAEDFTVVGIGDMSGDVFGNGMLLSERIQLVCAFDHRHIFLDPRPDAFASFAERRRLFDLPQSSWADYDTSLISEGGGVFARTAKSIRLTPQMRHVLGIEDTVVQMTPAQLIHAALQAPVALLWNGGIGTYVKAASESNLAVGDKANDATRVDGGQLRCGVVGEGGNLGFTQAGRIEAARSGVLLNTDAIDNSAGVDTSDHEVNIKILLDGIVRDGDLTEKQRNDLLHRMTDEVGELVLCDNYEQNILLGNARAQTGSMLTVHQRLLRDLEKRGRINRSVEGLPADAVFDEMAAARVGLTSPEFAVLMAYSKMTLVDDLASTPVPDEPWFERFLVDYFPTLIRERYSDHLAGHALRRQIIATCLANDIVNRGGITFVFRAQEETSADAGAVARVYAVAREVFGLGGLWAEVEALDNQVPTAAQSALFLEIRRLLDRAIRWFLQNRAGQVDVAHEIERFATVVADLTPFVPDLLKGAERDRFEQRTAEFIELGVPRAISEQVAALLDVFGLLDVAQIAEVTANSPLATAQVYFAISERYEIDRLLLRITLLPREDRWQSLARFALRSDLYSALAGVTERVLATTSADQLPHQRIEDWETNGAEALARTRAVLLEVAANDTIDIAPISVGLRVLRNLVRST